MKKLLFIFFFQYIFPAIIYIPQDYTTIQEGINNASNGDILIIGRGLYEESLVISNKTLIFRSNYLSTLNNGDITLTTLSSLSNPALSLYNSEITLIGFSIAANQTGIYLEDSSIYLDKTIIFNAYHQGHAIDLNNSSLSASQSTLYGFDYSINGDINSSITINSSILWPYNQIINS